MGGTAFVDGGAGALAGLGAALLDARGRRLRPVPPELVRLERLDLSELHPAARRARWILLVDVDNPLLGPEGAARVYGPQKGAGPSDLPLLERALLRVVAAVEAAGGRLDVRQSGLGAGGGLAVPFVGLLDAEMRMGAAVVCEAVGLRAALVGARLVLTGEGRYDGQTRYGKAPVEVARLARQVGLEVIMVAGQVAPGAAAGPFSRVVEASGRLPPSPSQARDELAEAARRAVAQWLREAPGP